MEDYRIGLDIGGTKCAASVGKATDGEMSVLCRKKGKTEILPTDTLEKLLPEIERHITKYDVKKIGISCSGTLDVDRGDYYLNDQTFRNEMRSCRVVQMAHHGQRGVTDYFYSMIDNIRVCLYAAPKWVFDYDENGKGVNTSNLDTMHTRDLMRERGVRYSFHAIDKDVRLG